MRAFFRTFHDKMFIMEEKRLQEAAGERRCGSEFVVNVLPVAHTRVREREMDKENCGFGVSSRSASCRQQQRERERPVYPVLAAARD